MDCEEEYWIELYCWPRVDGTNPWALRRLAKLGVRLVNPKGEVEIVQYKQWRKPVSEPHVRDLYGAMTDAKAARGWLWSPLGFSQAARRWAKGKPIVLADDEEIGRLVESVYGANGGAS